MPLAGLNDLVFGGWDIFEDTAYEAAVNAKVLERTAPRSAQGHPLRHQADEGGVRSELRPPHQRSQRQEKAAKMDKAEAVMEDIREFKASTGASRLVMIWCGSTEVFHKPAPVHQIARRLSKKGSLQERSGHRAQPDLRLRRAEIRRALRQRRAESDHRHARAAGTGHDTETSPSAARISRPARPS